MILGQVRLRVMMKVVVEENLDTAMIYSYLEACKYIWRCGRTFFPFVCMS